MTGPSPKFVILFCVESSCPQFGQALVGVRWMVARLSLVGKMSRTVTYQVEVRESDRARE